MARKIYCVVRVTWFFGKSPTHCSWYARANTDAFNSGKFSDAITEFCELEVVGNSALTMAKLHSELEERFRHRMTVVEVQSMRRSDYFSEKKAWQSVMDACG